MPRLIDANIIRDDFDPEDNMEYDAIGVRYIIDSAPTIDAIRAAGGCRCGECKYWDDDGRCEPPENGLIQEYTKPTDFCSYGEPREAQEDG